MLAFSILPLEQVLGMLVLLFGMFVALGGVLAFFVGKYAFSNPDKAFKCAKAAGSILKKRMMK